MQVFENPAEREAFWKNKDILTDPLEQSKVIYDKIFEQVTKFNNDSDPFKVTVISDFASIGKLNLTKIAVPKFETSKNAIMNGKRSFDKIKITQTVFISIESN